MRYVTLASAVAGPMPLRSILGLVVAFFGLACPAARGADYVVTASGPLAYVDGAANAFNGTATTTLPSLLDLDRLQGGSFRATFRFTPVTPAASGKDAVYELSPTSGMTSYELLDASGSVVHRGTNSSEPFALLENDEGSPPFSVDQVVLTSNVNDVSGLHVPAAVYSPTPYLNSVADFNVNGYVGNGVNYLNDLGIPSDAATYLSFPTDNAGRAFDVLMEFGDGDYLNQSGPYQHAYAQLQYDITALSVTQVPEPGAGLAAGVMGLLHLANRRRRRPAPALEKN